MKNYLFPITGAMALLSMASTLLGVESAKELKGRMSSPDGKVRSAAMEDFVKGMRSDYGGDYAAETTPVLISSLTDTDVNVRRYAVNGLLKIAVEASPIGLAKFGVSLPPNMPDLTKYELLQQALAGAASDQDASVRQMALAAYSAIYKLSPYLENKVIEEFNGPDPDMLHQPFGKTGLLECLMMSGSPSSVAVNFLTKLLDDPQYEWNIINRMGTDGCPLSPEVLARFAEMLSKEKDVGHKQDLVRAIGAYGAAAAPYLPQLEKMLAQEPSDSGLRLDLQNVIKQIHEAVNKASQPAPVSTVTSTVQQSIPSVTPTPRLTPGSTGTPAQPSSSNPFILPITIGLAGLLIGIVAYLFRSKP